jgi:hypothetical protein
VRNARPAVQLLHDCSHLGNCYAPNRFLFLLLRHYLSADPDRNDGLAPHRPGHSVIAIESADGHRCRRDVSSQCRGRPHHVTIVPKPNCWTPADPAGQQQVDRWDAVIVRFGPNSGPPIDPVGTTPADVPPLLPPRRQVLPFYICDG